MVLEVLQPGLYTTVQDEGRPGFGHLGVSRSGAMDADGLRLANLMVGNTRSAAGLEMTATGPLLQAQGDAAVALVGCGWYMVDGGGNMISSPGIHLLNTGDTLQVGRQPRASCRAYLALHGGIESPAVMGSRSTDSRAEIGGIGGGRLTGGDHIEAGFSAENTPTAITIDRIELPQHVQPLVKREWTGDCQVRVVMGPHDGYFDPSQKDVFLSTDYTVSTTSNRVGFRLEGPRLAVLEKGSLLSEGMTAGCVQVPPGGQPILLTADCQTMGGYPVICTVVSADLGTVGRCGPGDVLKFSAITREQAEMIKMLQARDWRRFELAMRPQDS